MSKPPCQFTLWETLENGSRRFKCDVCDFTTAPIYNPAYGPKNIIRQQCVKPHAGLGDRIYMLLRWLGLYRLFPKLSGCQACNNRRLYWNAVGNKLRARFRFVAILLFSNSLIAKIFRRRG